MNTTELRGLRRRLFHEGQPPSSALRSAVAVSWQRCVQSGLDPYDKKIPENILPEHILRIRQEQREGLIAIVAPAMSYLHSLITNSGSMILLADTQGLILHAVGDSGFLEKADSVLLKPGASWQERHRGTNAVGTTLMEKRPVSINGSEHYFEKHGFLACAAAPIRNHMGQVVGVLDISSDCRAYHPHTLGLVQATVDQVEKQWLFKEKPAGAIVVTLHTQTHALGTLAEGVLFLSEDGSVVGCNGRGAFWLNLQVHELGRFKLQQMLDIQWNTLLDRSICQSVQQLECNGFDGKKYCLRLDFSDFRARAECQIIEAAFKPKTLALREKMRSTIETALEQCAGNVSQAAKILGVSRTTLYRHLQRKGNAKTS